MLAHWMCALEIPVEVPLALESTLHKLAASVGTFKWPLRSVFILKMPVKVLGVGKALWASSHPDNDVAFRGPVRVVWTGLVFVHFHAQAVFTINTHQ